MGSARVVVRGETMKRPSREELASWYEEEGSTDKRVARHYGVTPQTVARWRKHYKLRLRRVVRYVLVGW
jgi:transposase-like protein